MPARDPPDPLDALLRPPVDETPEEKVMRLAQEAEAERISQAIDEDIKRERALRKKKQIVKLLLLGQSESGEFDTEPPPPGGTPLAGATMDHRRHHASVVVRDRFLGPSLDRASGDVPTAEGGVHARGCCTHIVCCR
jgi:hypothetical protein